MTATAPPAPVAKARPPAGLFVLLGVLVAVGAAMLVGALVYKANATKKVDDANLALGRATA
jgi:hypothetical protein